MAVISDDAPRQHRGGGEVSNLLPKETLRYVLQYGGRCRDCADHFGICPNSGLPCAETGKAVQWVIDAINYGVEAGYLKIARPASATTERGDGK